MSKNKNPPPKKGGSPPSQAGASQGQNGNKFFLNNGLVLSVRSGDITKTSDMAGAVVVGDDDGFSGKGAVATALDKAGRESYRSAREKMIKEIKEKNLPGPVYYSAAGKALRYRVVYHAMTTFKAGRKPPKGHLKDLFFRVGELAGRQGVATVVTPLLGAGQARGSLQDSIQAAVEGLSVVEPRSLQEVTIVEFQPEKANDIKKELQRILEAAATGAGGGAGGMPPPAGYRQGSMHGGSSRASSSSSSSAGQGASRPPPRPPPRSAGKRSSTGNERLPRDTRPGIYPKGIVEDRRQIYEGASSNQRDPSPSFASKDPRNSKKTYAQVAAGAGAYTTERTTGQHSRQSSGGGGGGGGGNERGGHPDTGPRNSRGERTPERGTDHLSSWEPLPQSPPPAWTGQQGQQNQESSSVEALPPREHRLDIRYMSSSANEEDEEDEEDEEEEVQSAPGHDGHVISNRKGRPLLHGGDARETSSNEESKEENPRNTSRWSAEKYSPEERNSSATPATHDEYEQNSGHSSDPQAPGDQLQRATVWSSSSVEDDPSPPNPPPRRRRKDQRVRNVRQNGNVPEGTDDRGRGDQRDGVPEDETRAARAAGETGASAQGHGGHAQRDAENRSPGPTSVQEGRMPEGKMVDSVKPGVHLEGFPDCGAILIEYSFPNGMQREDHPAPGQPYKGTFRRAFLPDNQEGRRVLDLLKKAFHRKLTFELVQSGPEQEWGVEFADIPHKTSLRGGPQGKGYPDAGYLGTVMRILRGKGLGMKQTEV